MTFIENIKYEVMALKSDLLRNEMLGPFNILTGFELIAIKEKNYSIS
jgi:hypothetical protein